jgi:hypothetical protein
MKSIPLEDAHKILQDASAIITHQGFLTYPSTNEDLYFSDENEFLYITWTDDDGQEHTLTFTEGDNQEVKISGSSMFLLDTDSEGEEDAIQITILTGKELE